MALTNKTLQRVRHETRIRVLDVTGVDTITPLMRRITLKGDMTGFASASYDDHIKVFIPAPGEDLVLPVLTPEGLRFEGKRPEMRDYTPRSFDVERGTLILDFVLHGDGPASTWAAQASIGQKLVIGGPRGSMIVPMAFDWYLLVGDETALPAISRRIEELPEASKAIVILEVDSEAEEQALVSKASLTLTWVHRNGLPAGKTDLARKALAQTALPEGDGFMYLAGESNWAKAMRADLEARGQNPAFIKAAGYWLYGVADAEEPH